MSYIKCFLCIFVFSAVFIFYLKRTTSTPSSAMTSSSLRLPQHLRGDGIKLNVKSTEGKVCLDHGR